MTNMELERLIKSYCEYQNMQSQIKSCMEDIKADIVTELTARDITGYTGNDHKVTYCRVESNRIDTKAVKEKHPEVAAECTKKSVAYRFTVK